MENTRFPGAFAHFRIRRAIQRAVHPETRPFRLDPRGIVCFGQFLRLICHFITHLLDIPAGLRYASNFDASILTTWRYRPAPDGFWIVCCFFNSSSYRSKQDNFASSPCGSGQRIAVAGCRMRFSRQSFAITQGSKILHFMPRRHVAERAAAEYRYASTTRRM